ncbi:helix-hairpin-helix domain-containing protein [Lactobacillus xylocopicola]|uniref:Competence protein n=1 Tax=Lactobacillus xylocopicola TaxID=2976676 RepID=A0ABN6SJH1_9LACO|nr:helix-hairpin-helix domain-containing protein [Lactobacillus xylocopicola]BDR60430.1 competence protein [Lactobacillus xylocopicola]
MDWEKIKQSAIDHKRYLVLGIVLLGLFFWFKHDRDQDKGTVSEFTANSQERPAKKASSDQENKSDQAESKTQEVTCDISGAVKHQGVYTLKNGARLQELLEAAGGPAANARLKEVNRALVLKDQDKIHIPYRGERIKATEIVTSVGGSGGETAATAESGGQTAGKINLNTASAQDLQKLSGIGEKKAAQIIAYRQKNGHFKKITDLKQVSGIGDKTFAALKDQLEV